MITANLSHYKSNSHWWDMFIARHYYIIERDTFSLLLLAMRNHDVVFAPLTAIPTEYRRQFYANHHIIHTQEYCASVSDSGLLDLSVIVILRKKNIFYNKRIKGNSK